MELLPTAGTRRREIAFKMIDGDFKLFEGKWSVQEVMSSCNLQCSQIPNQSWNPITLLPFPACDYCCTSNSSHQRPCSEYNPRLTDLHFGETPRFFTCPVHR
uniref:Uncharacterized protein n=1 Tax=Arundo donax TaxID=35708 RepID=A0A0A9F8F0_ARUDO